jgi:sorbitol/mannitol transport system substrate-binding protein
MRPLRVNYLKLALLLLCSFPILSVKAIDEIPNSLPIITIGTIEREPYSGAQLPENGYINAVIKAAFATQGYNTKFEFYPVARSNIMLLQGKLDILAPVHFDPKMTHTLTYSIPLNDGQFGFLKAKSTVIRDINTKGFNWLSGLNVGLVRNSPIGQEIHNYPAINIQYVNSDLQNLDMLAKNRVQIIAIDKYTAADLMVNQRPHLINHYEFVQPVGYHLPFHLVVNRQKFGSSELLQTFNQGLSHIMTNGKLDEIRHRHGFYTPIAAKPNVTLLEIGAVNINAIPSAIALSKEFEAANPDIQLHWRVMEESILRKRLLADLAILDKQFDVMMVGSFEAANWAKNQWLAPLTPQADYAYADIYPAVAQNLSTNNALYALPFVAESSVTYYRSDLFAQANISMPEQPSYQDLLTLAAALHDPANGIYGIGLRTKPGWGQNMPLITLLVRNMGGDWFDTDFKPTMNSQAWRKALTLYKTLVTQYGPPQPRLNGWSELQELYIDGKLAIWLDATSLASAIFNATPAIAAKTTKLAPTPKESNDVTATWLWSWNFAIPKTTQKTAAAQRFINWITSKSYVELASQQMGLSAIPLGARQSSLRLHQNQPAYFPFIDTVMTNISSAQQKDIVNYISLPEYPALGYGVGLLIADYIDGILTIDEVLMAMQNKVTVIMRATNYASEEKARSQPPSTTPDQSTPEQID